jgi:hypothetical protein
MLGETVEREKSERKKTLDDAKEATSAARA